MTVLFFKNMNVHVLPMLIGLLFCYLGNSQHFLQQHLGRNKFYETLILQTAFFPFAVFTVMVAVPFFFAVTFPLLLTEAIFELLLDHVSDLYVVLFGLMTAFN